MGNHKNKDIFCTFTKNNSFVKKRVFLVSMRFYRTMKTVISDT